MPTSNKTSKSNGGAKVETAVEAIAEPSPEQKSPTNDSILSSQNLLGNLVYLSFVGAAIYYIGTCAYQIRLSAIKEYGPIIHEFDPYFNWRATEVRIATKLFLKINLHLILFCITFAYFIVSIFQRLAKIREMV